MELETILKEKFHFTSFRQGQKEIIQDMIQGKNVVAMLPTGAGKSVCYQLPGYVLEGTVLIVSPLLSLMEDQVQQLKSRGEKKVVALNSFLPYPKKKQVLNHLYQYRFIYASPEILQSNEVIQAIQSIKISLFVIDEAHCISQWGHEFRTDYLKLADVQMKIGNPPCLASTATATKEILKDIILQLELSDVVKHIYSVNRPNISLLVNKVDSLDQKIMDTIEYVKTLQGPGIIYFSSRMWAEKMTVALRQNGMERVAYYHGGLENTDRLLIQQQFIHDQLDVICCTNAFGMGIDKPNVRFITHFHYPSQFESYIQEIGRAGRDGQSSIAILLYCDEDHEIANNIVSYDLPNENEWNLVFHFITNSLYNQSIDELEQMVGITYGISDVKLRYMKFQLEKHKIYVNGKVNQKISIDDVKINIMNEVQERVNVKQQNLVAFKKWIVGQSQCRRKALLQQFDQKLSTSQEQCCDYCGLDLQKYKVFNNKLNSYFLQNWEEELKLIFKQSGERCNG